MEIALQCLYPDNFSRPCLHLQGLRVSYPIVETVATFTGPHSVPVICYLSGPGPPAFSFGPTAASRWDASVFSVPCHLQQTEPLTMAAGVLRRPWRTSPAPGNTQARSSPNPSGSPPTPSPLCNQPVRLHLDLAHLFGTTMIGCSTVGLASLSAVMHFISPITLLPKPSYACV